MNFTAKNFFVVRHKSRYSSKSATCFDLEIKNIKQNCQFNFYYNKIDIKHRVPDRGNEIILPNWPDDKHIICTINNNIPIKILTHPYVFLSRNVLCNCVIEVGNNFLLESLAACHNA